MLGYWCYVLGVYFTAAEAAVPAISFSFLASYFTQDHLHEPDAAFELKLRSYSSEAELLVVTAPTNLPAFPVA